MIKLFEFLIDGCWHQWKDWSVVKATNNNVVVGAVVFCRCTKCGRHKRFNLN